MRAATIAAALAALAGCGGGGASAEGRIAFLRVVDGKADVYVMDADGTNIRRLTTGGAAGELGNNVLPIAPSWSPDGKRIAFAKTEGLKLTTYVVSADGGKPKLVLEDAGAPAWSPDGDEILVSRRAGAYAALWAVRPDGTGARGIIRNAILATWSPDSKRIAFIRPSGGGRTLLGALPNGRNATPLVTKLYEPYYSWSSDGKIAFVGESGNDNADIYVVPVGGGERTRLTDAREVDESPSWSPDAKWIVYSQRSTQGDELWLVDADGKNRKRLTSNTVRDVAPAWSPA